MRKNNKKNKVKYFKELPIDPLIIDIKKSFDELKVSQGSEFVPAKEREIVALIAYLQRLGTMGEVLTNK